MLLYTIIIIILFVKNVYSYNAGTTLFVRHLKGDCWSEDEIAKLRARKIYEQLMLPQVTPDRITCKYIKKSLQYFHSALSLVEKDTDPHTADLMKQSLSDTIGSHLRSEILPLARFAYYAGYIPYNNVNEIHKFYESIKLYLNSQGQGWKTPERVPQWSNLTVAKIAIGSGKLVDPCSCLITKRDTNSCIHLPVPKLDDRQNPSAIVLPFTSGGIVSLTSENAENILLKYYTTASRCILNSSPQHCRHSDFLNFNNAMWHWMKRDVAPSLVDEKLFSAYGGVLRIAAAVQSYGKGLSRRNLFEFYSQPETKWNPLNSYLFVNCDWTPKIYILLVLMSALILCLLQILYSYLLSGTCCGCENCPKTFRNNSKQIAYTHINSSILPIHKKAAPGTRTSSKTKSASIGSVKTQKVYDMNENTEKMMEVIMSDSADSVNYSSGSENDESDVDLSNKYNTSSNRLESPPKIDSSVKQIKVKKSPRKERRMPMYTTSTATRSDKQYSYREPVSDTAMSDNSISTQSISSTTSVSRIRSSRDLAWTRSIAPTQSVKSHTSTTELEVHSYSTPPSKR